MFKGLDTLLYLFPWHIPFNYFYLEIYTSSIPTSSPSALRYVGCPPCPTPAYAAGRCWCWHWSRISTSFLYTTFSLTLILETSFAKFHYATWIMWTNTG